MDFELPEEFRMINDLARRFVRDVMLPLEPAFLQREVEGKGCYLTPEEHAMADAKAREYGLVGLDAPEEYGGHNLPVVAMIGVNEALGYTCINHHLPPDTPNLRVLAQVATPEQRVKYLEPYARGETRSAIVISEPGAGADPAGIATRAVRDGDHWVLNGRKIWISFIDKADFGIVIARTDGKPGDRNGISAFIVDTDAPGFSLARKIPMLAGHHTHEVAFDNCRIPLGNLLGQEGRGFEIMQDRLNARRAQMAAWAIGRAQRALDMMVGHVRERRTFGQRLSDRQTIQNWIAEAETGIHAARLMIYEAAWRIDRGDSARTQLSMVKVFAPEMAASVIDHAMQAFGGMGMSRELPLYMMAADARLMRVYEGPTEVHKWVVARNRLAANG